MPAFRAINSLFARSRSQSLIIGVSLLGSYWYTSKTRWNFPLLRFTIESPSRKTHCLSIILFISCDRVTITELTRFYFDSNKVLWLSIMKFDSNLTRFRPDLELILTRLCLIWIISVPLEDRWSIQASTVGAARTNKAIFCNWSWPWWKILRMHCEV